MKNLPSFAQHNKETKDFTIARTNDLGLIGEYTVTLRSEIQIPDDHTGATFSQKMVQYDFIIQVEECTVEAFKKDKVIELISYHINSPALKSQVYSFVETPACQYPQNVIINNLPSFVTHNADTRDFTIPQIGDHSILGQYIVTLRSEISIPDDFTMTTYTTLYDEYDFVINIEPCSVLTYEPDVKLVALLYDVGGPTKTDGSYSFA